MSACSYVHCAISIIDYINLFTLTKKIKGVEEEHSSNGTSTRTEMNINLKLNETNSNSFHFFAKCTVK